MIGLSFKNVAESYFITALQLGSYKWFKYPWPVCSLGEDKNEEIPSSFIKVSHALSDWQNEDRQIGTPIQIYCGIALSLSTDGQMVAS